LARFDDFAPQQFNQQNTQLSFSEGQPDEGLVLSAPTGSEPIPPPWQIELRKQNNTDQYKVESDSKLYKGLGNWDNVTVSGLGTWQSASEGYIILKGVVNNGTVQSASIQKETTLPDRIKFTSGNNPRQTEFVTQLGYIFMQEGSLQVRQNAFHNFTLLDSCVNGKAATYPIAT
jgi:hypothetical protein